MENQYLTEDSFVKDWYEEWNPSEWAIEDIPGDLTFGELRDLIEEVNADKDLTKFLPSFPDIGYMDSAVRDNIWDAQELLFGPLV